MQKCWIDGREYWLHGGCWVPPSHFHDCGQEMLYVGPPRSRRSRRPLDWLGLVLGIPLYAFIFHELFLR
jgi:hypothetical protein